MDLTLKQYSEHLHRRLETRYSVGESDAMVRIVMEEMLNCSPVDVILRKDTTISAFMQEKIDKVVNRLLSGEPIQYIFGQTIFCGFKLKVTPDVLIPRPETEELVDMVVKRWRNISDLDVLDVATGSGCIAVSLARALKFAKVSAIDISPKALAVARENARRLNVKVNYVQADARALEVPEEPCYDIIVSNPPYVLDSERQTMDANVLDYEPHLALFVPDDDALRFYDAIARYAVGALRPQGMIYFEINSRKGDEVAELLASLGFVDVECSVDMYGNRRFVVATKPKEIW